MKKELTCWVVLFSLLGFSQQAWTADNLPAAGTAPDVVYLRHDCGTMPDCSESMSDLLDWIWDTRQPSATDPLLVDIGAGTFNIGATWTDFWVRPNGAIRRNAYPRIFCEDAGHVTFRGAGRGNTIITGKGIGASPTAAFPLYEPVLTIKNCDNLVFQDMDITDQGMISADEPGVVNDSGASGHGIFWWGGGRSTWSNVGVLASGYGWLDTCSGGGVPGEHKWFGSTVQSGPYGYYNVAYRSDCGVNEFFGGDIKAIKANVGVSFSLVGVQTGHTDGSVAIYGALVRTVIPPTSVDTIGYTNQGTSQGAGHGGLHAKAGTIHMHGGIVSVRVEVSGVDSEVFGAKAAATGTIHTPDTAFGLKPGGAGVAQRVIGATVMAPYQWPSDVTPPSISSLTGADTFIETDCDSDGNCDSATGATHPHLMVYDADCNGGADPWFNSTLGECRGIDPAP